MDTETMARTALTNCFLQVRNITIEISSNDRTMSWDGFLYLGTKENKNGQIPKDAFFGRIPVQLKGHRINQNEKLKQDTITFPIDISDLKNYRKDGGALFFVVYIDVKMKTSEVYFIDLLPVVIDALLTGIKEKSKQKTLSTWLHPFPQDEKTISKLIFTFCDNQKRQTSFSPESIIKQSEFAEYIKKGIPFRAHIVSPRTGADSSMNYLFQAPISLYAVKDGIEVPVGGMTTVAKLAPNTVISVSGKEYFSSCFTSLSNDNITCSFGDLILVTFKLDHSIKLSLKLQGSLKQRLLTLKFLIDMTCAGTFQINNDSLTLPKNASKQLNIEEMKRNFKFLEDVKETLEILNVDSDLNMDNLSRNDLQNLHMLIAAIKYKEPVDLGTGENLVELFSISIGNLELLLLRNQLESKKWTVKNFFSHQFVINSQKQRISHYVFLKKTNFIESSNINYSMITKDIMDMEKEEETYDYYNNLLMEMLLAYDEGTKHQDELIDSATKISDMIYHYANFPKEISMLNYYQCIKRLRDLTDGEYDKIGSFASNPNLELKFKTGAYLLVENQGRAKRCFDSMTEDDKSQFKKFPIMRFWKS